MGKSLVKEYTGFYGEHIQVYEEAIPAESTVQEHKADEALIHSEPDAVFNSFIAMNIHSYATSVWIRNNIKLDMDFPTRLSVWSVNLPIGTSLSKDYYDIRVERYMEITEKWVKDKLVSVSSDKKYRYAFDLAYTANYGTLLDINRVSDTELYTTYSNIYDGMGLLHDKSVLNQLIRSHRKEIIDYFKSNIEFPCDSRILLRNTGVPHIKVTKVRGRYLYLPVFKYTTKCRITDNTFEILDMTFSNIRHRFELYTSYR